MALRQTLQRNVFRRPVDTAPPKVPPAVGGGRAPQSKDAPAEAAAVPEPAKAAPAPTGPAVGRNDPCPCGSGKKSKRCCAGQAKPS